MLLGINSAGKEEGEREGEGRKKTERNADEGGNDESRVTERTCFLFGDEGRELPVAM